MCEIIDDNNIYIFLLLFSYILLNKKEKRLYLCLSLRCAAPQLRSSLLISYTIDVYIYTQTQPLKHKIYIVGLSHVVSRYLYTFQYIYKFKIKNNKCEAETFTRFIFFECVAINGI